MTTDRPQPQPGDVIVGCKHRPKLTSAHVFKLTQGIGLSFTRPNGTTGKADWIFLCDKCFRKHVLTGGLATDAPLSCDFVWKESHGKLNFGKPS